MTFIDRQHSLTTRFVSMVSVMNIHASTNRMNRTTRMIDEKQLASLVRGTGRTTREYI